MKERRKKRDAENGEERKTKCVRFAGDGSDVEAEEDLSSMEEDSDEVVYDSEEEDAAEEEFRKKQEKMIDAAKPKKVVAPDEEAAYDVAAEVKQSQKYKAVDGVKFVEYDELGLIKNDGVNHREWITTDTKELDTVIPAPPELMEALKPKGVHTNQDKAREDMNAEEKAAFDAL